MSSYTMTVRGVVSERGMDAARASDAGLNALNIATVYVDNNSVSWVGGTDTVTLNLATAIQNSRRDGKTVTIQGLPVVTQCLTTQSTAGAEVPYCAFLSLSSNTVTLTPKSNGYLTGSTDATIGALPAVRPYAITCAYSVA